MTEDTTQWYRETVKNVTQDKEYRENLQKISRAEHDTLILKSLSGELSSKQLAVSPANIQHLLFTKGYEGFTLEEITAFIVSTQQK